MNRRIALILLSLTASYFYSSAQVRVNQPVVLTGESLQGITGFPADAIAGFRYTGDHWEQVPVQIDQRDYRSAFDLYNAKNNNLQTHDYLVYCDPKTYSGEDSDPLIDENDELVFMSQDLGLLYEGDDYPEYTLYDPVMFEVYDPTTEEAGYLYLFLQTGALPLDAGRPYVTYEYQLLTNGPFKNAYDITGPNPEDSYITTSYYEQHFSDDWIRDQIVITTDNAPGVDILDYDKLQLAPGLCYRHIGTFSEGSGTHIASTSGGVRAIRSIMGANSGALIQRTQLFYAHKDETETIWRVHPVRGITEYYDYTEDALGMVYYNEHNLQGVIIDGQEDELDTRFAKWSLLSGTPGSILTFTDLEADFPLTGLHNYYHDQRNSNTDQCIGDQHAMGANGFFLQQQIPNTDPRDGAYNSLTIRAESYYLPPDQSLAVIFEHYLEEDEPMITETEGTFLVEKETAELLVFPNPTTDYLNIQIFPTGHTPIALYDLQGNLILERTIFFAHYLTIPEQVPSGLYVLRAISGDEVLSQKIYIRR
ncbi:MAG: T9SS type A sorting domain-containing protein [Bacteroidota bacterium]